MSNDRMTITTIYLRHTDASGKSYVADHRTWDAKLFFQSQSDSVAAILAKTPGKNKVELATKADYDAGRER